MNSSFITSRPGVRSAMCAASQLPGGGGGALMWMMLLLFYDDND